MHSNFIDLLFRVQKKSERESVSFGQVLNVKNTMIRFIIQTFYILLLLLMSFAILIPGYEAFLKLDSLWQVNFSLHNYVTFVV